MARSNEAVAGFSALSDIGEHVWFCAIGLMVNPISLAARGLTPLESEPCELLNYSLEFKGPAGMATAIAASGFKFHCVLHLMSEADMQTLDKIEAGYNRVPATALLYKGELRQCTVYTMSAEKLTQLQLGDCTDSLPQRRYLDIILEGYTLFGVRNDGVAAIRAQRCSPRRSPADYEEFLAVPIGAPVFASSEVEAANGEEGKPLYCVLGGRKVLEWTGPISGPLFQHTLENRHNDMLLLLAKMFYEPLHGTPPATLDEMTPEQLAYREDQFAQMSKRLPRQVWKLAGTIAQGSFAKLSLLKEAARVDQSPVAPVKLSAMCRTLPSIRQATSDDLETLVTIVNAAYQTEGVKLKDVPRTSLSAISRLRDEDNSGFVLAEFGGELAGSIYWRDEADGGVYFGMLSVTPSQQKRGIGGALLGEVEKCAAARGRTRLRCFVINLKRDLRRFYEKRGLIPTGERRPWDDEMIPKLLPEFQASEFLEYSKQIKISTSQTK